MPSRKRLHRVARKGEMWSHFDKFSNLLDKRKRGEMGEDIAGLYYKMYRTKSEQRRDMLRRKIRKGGPGSGGHPGKGDNIHQPGQWH